MSASGPKTVGFWGDVTGRPLAATDAELAIIPLDRPPTMVTEAEVKGARQTNRT